MSAAVAEVKAGNLKLRVAARAYNLPLGSLQRRVKGTVPVNIHTVAARHSSISVMSMP